MPKVIQGNLTGRGLKIGIVVSRFNEFITSKLLEGAVDCLLRHEVRDADITVAWVPGAFEIPAAARRLVERGGLDAAICLGAVIKGNTDHHHYIAGEAAKGIAQVGAQSNIPVIFGVITPDTLEQAIERAGAKSGNKGWDAALSAIEMANLYRQIGGRK